MLDPHQTPVAGAAPRNIGNARFIGDLMGSYVLASRSRSSDSVRVFACRARSISADAAVVSAPLIGDMGEGLTIKFEPLGILRGEISKVMPEGFAVRFITTQEEREKLDARIDWMKRRVLNSIPDRREHKRVLPRDSHAIISLSGGRRTPGLIIDMSKSGVAVSADVLPPLGTPLAVGSLLGKVVRHIEFGFAVQFLQLQELENVEALLTLRTQQAKSMAAAVIDDAKP